MMSPSRILPSVNFQPSSTHRTMPSSRTRLVEAIKKESAFTGWAPLTSTEREAASAANEQEDETNPKKMASPAFVGPRSPSTFAICSRVTRTWMPAEIMLQKMIAQCAFKSNPEHVRRGATAVSYLFFGFRMVQDQKRNA